MTLTRLRSLPAVALLALTAATLTLVAPSPAQAAPSGKFAGMHKARTADEKAAVRTVRKYNAAAVAGDGAAVCEHYTKKGQMAAVSTAAMFYKTSPNATCGEAMNVVYAKLEEYGFPQLKMRQARVKKLTSKTARVGYRTPEPPRWHRAGSGSAW